MNLTEQTRFYRDKTKECVLKGDALGARKNAILYSKLMAQLQGMVSGYTERASISAEREKYELVAAMLTRYGACDKVRAALGIPITGDISDNRHEVSDPSENGSEWSADIFEKYLSATAVIETDSGVGTGFFVTEDGYLITNRHVVYNGLGADRNIRLKSGDGKIRCACELINADKDRDVALLKAKASKKGNPFIPLISDYSSVRPGANMMIIGNALDFGLAPITGTVKFTRSRSGADLVYTAPTNNGDSGAPVINRHGQCIGIHKSTTTGQMIGTRIIDAKGLSNGTPSEDIRTLLKKWGVTL